MVFAFLENVLNLGTFPHAPVPHSKIQAECFENLFPLTPEMGGENYDLIYINLIRKYEDDLEGNTIILCMICNSSKCDGFTVL